MPNFWENLNFSRPTSQTHHNLQDGLFQIASQTCSILVKVNNTNNICYGNNSSNVHYDFAGNNGTNRNGRTKGVLSKKGSFSGYKQRLSTVLESTTFGNASATEEEFDQWEQSFMLREDRPNNSKKWAGDNWCRPSCIPISFILVLIILVVLVPLLEHTNSFSNAVSKSDNPYSCLDQCSLSLVETIPEGMILAPNSAKHRPTQESWLDLINIAQNTIEIASLYWTLRLNETYPHNSSIKGEEVFQALYNAGRNRGIKINIVQSAPTKNNPNPDTETLVKKNAAQVRSVNFPRLLGGGVLHTKLWLVDRTHFYLGSANMDWRSLTQVKELGIVGYNCSCIAKDVSKIFDVYWMLGKDDATIPASWPSVLQTKFNKEHPMNANISGHNYLLYASSSPPPLSPYGRTNDNDSIINVIKTAERFVYIAVMDYFPLMLYTPKTKYWSHIDDAIRTAAIDNKVNIRMLISWWNHSRPSEDHFLLSLSVLSNSYPNVQVNVKRYVVPANADQKKIPYARVNHNKYMVTDKVAYIGTSNWSGDYFVDTAGIGLVFEEPDHVRFTSNTTEPGIRQQLQEVFERDWNSPYALELMH